MTPSPSLARGFFEQITQSRDPVAAVRDLINSSPPTAETDWLDFKTEHLDPKQRDRKTRETWSEALGGFANNQGGVLIWGVDAR
ncbi:MAG TPA: RNA-binding domain-containing protein, partial [Gemmataceae bacterium]|nr:RNA-binding domain-containing protein [Gemmataceae bacterium]